MASVRFHRFLAFAVLVAATAIAKIAPAVTLQTVASGLNVPLYVTHAGDARLFIVERPGTIRVYSGGSLLATPFLDIQAKTTTDGERGLLSLAFHPDYASNGFFFVYYTNLSGNLVIERYHVNGDPHTTNVADANSAATLLSISHPQENNHNGGQLQIGPLDGFLYAGTGDGGGAGDTLCNAQNTSSMLGKILRLDVRQNLNQAPFYGIPAGNPFVGSGDPGGQIPDEIWAIGLRNPWRFSFDRVTGDLFIGDVGQNLFEEVDLQKAGVAPGKNYGWKPMEGLHCFDSSGCAVGTPACNSPALTLPIHEYPHSSGDCAVTGGYRYRGPSLADVSGKYVFADYCTGAMRTLTEVSPGNWQAQALLTASSVVTSFGEGANGELYATVGNDVVKFVGPPGAPALGSVQAVVVLSAVLSVAGLLVLRRRRFATS